MKEKKPMDPIKKIKNEGVWKEEKNAHSENGLF